MTKDELIALVGNPQVEREMDVRLLVLDVIRERLKDDELLKLFWDFLPDLDEEYIRGYFYRKRY